MTLTDQTESVPDKDHQDLVPIEISNEQQGAQAGDHEKTPTEDPAFDMLPGHVQITAPDTYFFDASFNLLFDDPSLTGGFNGCFVGLDVQEQAAGQHWKGDTSPAETVVPDKLLSCQCQASIRMCLAEIEQNIKDHFDKSLQLHVKLWFKEEISNWLDEAWYEKRREPSTGFVPKQA